MRGKEERLLHVDQPLGITPAHAGKRCRSPPHQSNARDHPRTCGEKRLSWASVPCGSGSPPHMRGKVCTISPADSIIGITPAHAGKSVIQQRTLALAQDHPRTCGEKKDGGSPRCAAQGSPPHMRGKASTFPAAFFASGITPAHAGKSQHRARVPCHMRDHPRTCGEKETSKDHPEPEQGSPPHMRGKAHVCVVNVHKIRITPAHAGKSESHKRLHRGNRDHPRTCGEKKKSSSTPKCAEGSPPHMRGKVDARCAPVRRFGITPAHAGKSP